MQRRRLGFGVTVAVGIGDGVGLGAPGGVAVGGGCGLAVENTKIRSGWPAMPWYEQLPLGQTVDAWAGEEGVPVGAADADAATTTTAAPKTNFTLFGFMALRTSVTGEMGFLQNRGQWRWLRNKSYVGPRPVRNVAEFA